HLSSGIVVNMLLNRTSNNPNGTGSATPYLDNNNNANNSTLSIHNANAKVLGLRSATDAAQDASITFSSNFTWDFDPRDGITAGSFDFVGAATHEIGHALGFVSGEDILDTNSSGTFLPDSSFVNLSVLDLY